MRNTVDQPTPKQLQAWKANLTTLVRECSESPNLYLRNFASSPLSTLFLTDERVIGCFGRKSRSFLRKELMEAAALEARLQRVYNPHNDNTQLVIWDLCSGKGFSAAWLSMNTYPDATIHLVDNDTKTNRNYIEAFPKLTYHNLDMYSFELEESIRGSCVDNATVLLVGIHLCGDLSRRALELRNTTGASTAVVSPCCAMRLVAPKKRHPGSFGYNVPQVARQLKVVTPYDLWCWMLWGYACSSPNNNSRRRVDLTADPLMRTDKNKWLVVIDEKPAS